MPTRPGEPRIKYVVRSYDVNANLDIFFVIILFQQKFVNKILNSWIHYILLIYYFSFQIWKFNTEINMTTLTSIVVSIF